MRVWCLLLVAAVFACDDAPDDAPDEGTMDGPDTGPADQLYAAVNATPRDSVERLEAAAGAVRGHCAAEADRRVVELARLAERRAVTRSIDCSADADWLDTLSDALDVHDGDGWLVVELSGACEVPDDHPEDAVVSLEGAQRVELRGVGDVSIDAADWSRARTAESVVFHVSDAESVVLRDLHLTGVGTAAEGEDAGGIRVEGSSAVLVEGIELEGIEVDYDAPGDNGERNAFAIKVTGTPDAPSAQIVVRDNTVVSTRTGQSENVTIAGDVRAFAVTGNVVRDVDNIAIDLIGGEDYDGAQAREGVVCGNAVGQQQTRNPAYEDGDAAAAGIYLDGGGTDCLVAYNLVEGFSRGFEVGAEQANPAVLRAHLVGNISVAARGAGLLLGSLAERVDPTEPTDEETRVERHLVVANPSDDAASCLGGEVGDDEGAVQCEAGSVRRRGVEICLAAKVPASPSRCDWHHQPAG